MLVPSIDLKGGQVVQLIQGERPAIASDDIESWVTRFQHFPRVQVIDLDAAMGSGTNDGIVREIAPRLTCRVGGGIRTVERARAVLGYGASAVIVGSSLFRNGRPDLAFAETLAAAVGRDRIIAAVDSRGGQVVIKGWKESVALAAADAVEALEPFCGEFLYTHVDKEGLMQGTDLDAIMAVRRATTRRLTAAGGITTQAEIDALDAAGIDAVVGMAIYTGRLPLPEPPPEAGGSGRSPELMKPRSPEVVKPSPSDWVWKLARRAVSTFYRIERVGEPLPGGPVLLVANHPNTLVDPALIQASAGCSVRFLAKSTLFAGHPLSWVIRASGAIPAYRKIDPGVDTSRNVETFAAVDAALAAGEAVCLFPEGISHSEGRLEPLRTGAARMVLSSGAAGHPVTIVPVGLNFEHVASFRSRVTVFFGRPFNADDIAAAYAADEQAAVRRLTDRIEQRLRRLMIEAEPRHDLPIVMRIDHLYAAARGVSRDPRERVVRRRVIASGMAQLRDRAPERLAEITASVGEYDASLARFGLRDRDIDRRIPFAAAARFAVREGLLAVVLVPLALLSLAFFVVPYQLTALVSRFAPDLKSRGIWSVCAGIVAYGGWTGAIAGAVAWRTDAASGLLAGGGVVALAFGGVAAIEREQAVLRTVRAFFALRQTPLGARARLRRQRAALADVLDQVHEWLGDRAETPRRTSTER